MVKYAVAAHYYNIYVQYHHNVVHTVQYIRYYLSSLNQHLMHHFSYTKLQGVWEVVH